MKKEIKLSLVAAALMSTGFGVQAAEIVANSTGDNNVVKATQTAPASNGTTMNIEVVANGAEVTATQTTTSGINTMDIDVLRPLMNGEPQDNHPGDHTVNATQTGGDNGLTISASGNHSLINAEQDGLDNTAFIYNDRGNAYKVGANHNNVDLSQVGDNNYASIDNDGSDNLGDPDSDTLVGLGINQLGNDNYATITNGGWNEHNTLTIDQSGDFHKAEIDNRFNESNNTLSISQRGGSAESQWGNEATIINGRGYDCCGITYDASNNTISIDQTGDNFASVTNEHAGGNTILVTQDGMNSANVVTDTLSSSHVTVDQKVGGEGDAMNTIDLLVGGDGLSMASLMQDGSGNQIGGSDARATAYDGDFAGGDFVLNADNSDFDAAQYGDDNVIVGSVNGSGHNIDITQDSTLAAEGNFAYFNISGTGHTANISQTGSANQAFITQQ
ncbi:hypothetical protein [Ferrimonas pelagia]